MKHTHKNYSEFYKLIPFKMFNILGKDTFAQDLNSMNQIRDLRVATQIQTDLAALSNNACEIRTH